MRFMPKESLKSIRVSNTDGNEFDLGKCYQDRDYYINHFAKCVGISDVSATGWIDDTLENILQFITTVFVNPAWNGLYIGANEGFTHLVTNVISPLFGVGFNATVNSAGTFIEAMKHILSGVASGTSIGLTNTVGPMVNSISGGLAGGIANFYNVFQNILANLSPSFMNAVNSFVRELSALPNLSWNIASIATNYIPKTITDVAERIATSLKSEYKNTASCEVLKYLWFDNPLVPYVYGAFPELGQASLSTFKTLCYSTYTEGFFENFMYPIATWGLPGSRTTSPLPTVKAVQYPTPQQVMESLSQMTFMKFLNGLIHDRNLSSFMNSFSFLVNTSSRDSDRDFDSLLDGDDLNMKTIQVKQSPAGEFSNEMYKYMVEVSSRVRKSFKKCNDVDKCCTIEEIITGLC